MWKKIKWWLFVLKYKAGLAKIGKDYIIPGMNEKELYHEYKTEYED